MCIALLVAASVTGTLTSRTRRSERLLRAREQRTATLYQIASDLSAALDRPAMARAVANNLTTLLKAEVGVAFKGMDEKLIGQGPGVHAIWMTVEKEWTVATWAFEHSKPAGWSTDTLASVGGLYIPLIGPTETVGVLGLKRGDSRSLPPDELNLVMAVARQLAVAAERELLQERAQKIHQLAESERLYQTILNTVSHELRTPLTAIIGNASAIGNEQIAADASRRQQLSSEIIANAARLNRVVSNLLDMSRLSSGKLVLKRDWHDLSDLISVTIDSQRSALASHSLSLRLADGLPLVRIDFQLLQQALANLLVNAATYAPVATSIVVAAQTVERVIELTVSDQGPGLPPEAIPHVFEMFYRVSGSKPGGAGIGLAIAKGIVELHGGSIEAENQTTGGARFIIKLPVESQPQGPQSRSEK
jgi:two-component system sensor histidine kinase KdpD